MKWIAENTGGHLRRYHECDSRKVLNAENIDEDIPGSWVTRGSVRSGI